MPWKEQIAKLPSFGHSALCLGGDEHFHFGPPRNHLWTTWANCMFTYSKRTTPRRHSSRMEKLTWKGLLTALSGITHSEATPMPLCRRTLAECGWKSLEGAMADQVAGWYWLGYGTDWFPSEIGWFNLVYGTQFSGKNDGWIRSLIHHIQYMTIRKNKSYGFNWCLDNVWIRMVEDLAEGLSQAPGWNQ